MVLLAPLIVREHLSLGRIHRARLVGVGVRVRVRVRVLVRVRAR